MLTFCLPSLMAVSNFSLSSIIDLMLFSWTAKPPAIAWPAWIRAALSLKLPAISFFLRRETSLFGSLDAFSNSFAPILLRNWRRRLYVLMSPALSRPASFATWDFGSSKAARYCSSPIILRICAICTCALCLRKSFSVKPSIALCASRLWPHSPCASSGPMREFFWCR